MNRPSFRPHWLWVIVLLVFLAALPACDESTSEHGSFSDDDSGDNGDDDNNQDGDDDQFLDDDSGGSTTVDDTLQALLEEYLLFSGEPGVAFAARYGNGTLHSLAAGKSNWIDGDPMVPGMLFRVGSCTKPFTATVLMQLADEGLVDLDAPMTDYLPQYDMWPNVTPRHLVRMQSGIPDYLMSNAFWINALLRLGKPLAPETLIMHATFMPTEFEPGTDCSYSNTNFVLAGLVIEQVTGNPVEQEIWDRVVKPLDLKHTFLDTEGREVDLLSHGYADAEIAGMALGIADDLTALVGLIPQEYVVDGLLFDGTYLFHPSFSFSAGALVSWGDDLVKFMDAYVHGELVSEERYQEMMDFAPCVCLGKPVDYSMGMMRRPTDFGYSYGHGGQHFGYSSNTYYLPDIDVIYSLLDNFVPDQSDYVLPDLLRTLINNQDQLPVACEPPEVFEDLPEGYNLQVRFRGPINSMFETDPEVGVSSTKALLSDNRWHAYYIMDSVATLESVFPRWVKVETYGPGDTEGYEMRSSTLYFRPHLLDQADANGLITIGPEQAEDVILYLADTRLDNTGEKLDKVCLTAVPNWEYEGYLYVCDRENFTGAVGDTIRLFGAFMVDWDSGSVEEYAASLDIGACECRNENNEWHPCPDTPQPDCGGDCE